MNTMHRGFRWLTVAGLALATVVLSGCATSRNVESEVRSFGGTTPIATGASYRFERLPSQAPKAQAPLEAAAEKALMTKGLVRNDNQPRYSVQLRLDSDVLIPDAATRWAHSPFPDRVLLAPDGTLWRQARRPFLESVWYRRTMQVVLRDLSNGNVAYETKAVHDSAWTDTHNLIAPLLEAALSDFPNSEPKPKTITVVLPPAETKP